MRKPLISSKWKSQENSGKRRKEYKSYIDIVGVTGSIPVAPTIFISGLVRKFSLIRNPAPNHRVHSCRHP